jgi:tRNA-dihydrouridine synthase A
MMLSPLEIAPMVDWTYSHFRVLMRLIAPSALLYTEMQTIGAVSHRAHRVLRYHPCEYPLVLQLGGAEPEALVRCAILAEKLGFAEVNINLGCPSERVQAGRFGACLMAEPVLVAKCIAAMKFSVKIPITAKIRLGVDHLDSYEYCENFVAQILDTGCDRLIVHARKAWLHGLNPKQNRTIPPLHYDYVYRIKAAFPHCPVVINGNIGSITEIQQHMSMVDGVMLGRLALQNPYALASIHQYFYPWQKQRSRVDIMQDYLHYARIQAANGEPWSLLLKPIFNFAFGLIGAKRWKKLLMRVQQEKQINLLEQAITLIDELEQTGVYE